jgi:hypothetical protein
MPAFSVPNLSVQPDRMVPTGFTPTIRRSGAVPFIDCAILLGLLGEVAEVEYEVWAGDGGRAIGYLLIPATETKRAEMRLAAPGSMQECIATFEADSFEDATALYEAMYEDLATTWEAKHSHPE